ncbi:MAG: phosphate acyltransferase PlsX [Acidobacteria bacterium]|nr:MAG: phosphate acyltransferase PlsX [Acidobacteriota bacterium]
MTRIVLDAMGGDHAPRSEVEGAIRAVRQLDVEVLLVGPRDRVRAELERQGGAEERAIRLIDAPEVIAMDEPLFQAIRRKHNSTIRVGMRLVREGLADGFVSAGNTGAIMAIAKMVIKPLGRIDRPALAAVLPTLSGRWTILLDVGANAECKPVHLLQFALMGDIFARTIMGVESPSVGLISIGEEQLKGNELTREAYRLLKKSGLRFVGNVEGQEIYRGCVDVIVCDGFTGNVILKVSEGLPPFLFKVLEEELLSHAQTEMGALLSRSALENIKRRFGYEAFGGAPLLGVKNVVVISHGRSTGRAIQNAIRVAAELCQKQVPSRIEREMEKLDQKSILLPEGAPS